MHEPLPLLHRTHAHLAFRVGRFNRVPNGLFLRGDECAVVLFPDGDFNFESIDAMEAVAEELSLNRNDLLDMSIADQIVTYGEFIAELSGRSAQ